MNKSGVGETAVSLPSGGGALAGMGESFSADLHTGTGNMTVPIAVPPGRLAPELQLVYSTGNGNGLFGMGWALSIPGVARDTAGRLPRYDRDDRFVLSGMERLVPIGGADAVTRYQPRTEGAFARIEHREAELDDYWEVRTKGGLVSRYGHAGARGMDSATVRNPSDARQVFAWQLTSTTDAFGNLVEYAYERDAVTRAGPHEWDQLRLSQIRYADYGPRSAPQFLVTVDFIHEDRPDPFSNRRAGFEIRTTKRCARIEVRTHAEETRLARVYRLFYDDQLAPESAARNALSLLRRIQVEGVDGDTREALPPLELHYTGFHPERRVYGPLIGPTTEREVPERSLAHPDFELADLFGRGLPDVVQISRNGSRYWKNLGGGRFDVPRTFAGTPPGLALGDRGVLLADMDGDGHVDMLVSSAPLAGYVPLAPEQTADRAAFRAYRAAPPFSFEDPEVRLLDLDGNGVTDALRTGAAFELYFHDREHGWTSTETRERGPIDRFPDVRFSDRRVKLADMTGDGLIDIVLVDQGRVDYWPYLGNGRWGERVTMSGELAFPDAASLGGIGFDPDRLLVGDIDGDGVADLVYVEHHRCTIWLNQSGNGWSQPITVNGTPPVSHIDSVRIADVLGTGAPGILWSYDLGAVADSSYKFLDLTGGTKPYLLSERDNHSGARTRIEYASSTHYRLEDERSLDPERQWRGRLPFPVQVVAKVETIDELSGGKRVTEHRYHQGHWDPGEREFRGFGLVEQLDTETFARYHQPAAGSWPPTHDHQRTLPGWGGESESGLGRVSTDPGVPVFAAVEPLRFSPPTLTRTWFHQGEVEDSAGIRSEGSLAGAALGDPAMLATTLRTELREIERAAALDGSHERLALALRALRGSILRSELYALDGSARQHRPYSVTETLYDVREIATSAGLGETIERVYAALQIANRTTEWERGDEPMTRLSFVGGHDEYGMPRSQLEIAVPRGRDPLVSLADPPPEPYLAKYAVTEYARRDDSERYIVERVARTTEYEIIDDGRASALALRDAVFAGIAEARVIGHARAYYDGDAFVGLPLGQLGDFGAAVRGEALMFEDAFLAGTSRPPYLDPTQTTWLAEYPARFRAELSPLAGYAHHTDSDVPGSPGGYYAVAARHRYDFHDAGAIARGNVRASRDPLGAETRVERDPYDLFAVRVTDALGLETIATHDYRAMQAATITDPNGTTTGATYSPAGLVTSKYVRGEHGEGDVAHPSVRFVYDLHAFAERKQPISIRTIRRVHRDSELDVPADRRDDTIERIEYSDGFGRLLQARAQAEELLFGDDVFGRGTLATSSITGRGAPDHVVVSGWQTHDNKGRVVEKYEPFFSRGWDYQVSADTQRGQKTQLFYDPCGHLVRTVNPDGSEQLVVRGIPAHLAAPGEYHPTPWEAYTYDANDNAGRTHETAAGSFAGHWNTPSSLTVDALGRPVTAVARNGPDPSDWITTRSSYDLRGNVVTLIDGLGRAAFRSTFDLANRRWRVESIDAGRRDTVPDVIGAPVESRDARGALSLASYDAAHRPRHMWARDDAAAPVTLRERNTYGDEGDRVVARAANLIGRLVEQHDGTGVLAIHACDFTGNITSKSRRMIADAALTKTFAGAESRAWRIEPFVVDWEPGPGSTPGDVDASLLEATRYETDASYDGLGRAKIVQLPRDVQGGRKTVIPSYNSAGALEQVAIDDEPYVERIAYDAGGRRTLIAYGNGVMTRSAYDPRTFRLQRMRSERYVKPDALTYASQGHVVQDTAYAYDLSGNVLSITDRAPGSGTSGQPDELIRAFEYDPIYRLTRATGRECDLPSDAPPWLDQPRGTDLTRTRGYTERYQYDVAGNLRLLSHHATTGGGYVRELGVEPTSNRLNAVRIGATTLSYAADANGNTLAESASRHFEWGFGDQLKAFRTQPGTAEPSVHAQYLYDGAGQRAKKLVRKQGGSIEVTHYIDGAFEHHRWASGENNHVHLADDLQRIALVRVGVAAPGDASPAVQYQLGDHLGSSAVVLDNSGALVKREEFTPYGETSFGGFARKRYRFTGMERDEESGLAYHGARYYASWIARWASPDPAGPIDGLNAFAYARNNPIGRHDRGGRDSATFSEGVRERDPSMEPGDSGLAWDPRRNTWLLNDEATGKWFQWRGGGWFEDASEYLYIQDTKPRDLSKQSFFEKELDFAFGVAKSGAKAVSGLYHMVRHPVQTTEGLIRLTDYVITHPIQSAKAVGNAIYDRGAQIWSGDFVALGETSGDILQLFLTPGAGADDAATIGGRVAAAEAKRLAAGAERAAARGTGGAVEAAPRAPFQVTPEGVALPGEGKYQIPSRFVENPHRTGSYGEIVDGKFVERLRIDPPTPPGTKGPNYSHYHLDGGRTHYSPRPGDRNPGFPR
ncbi:MAG: VCBS repeat-containing protein [Deltaproteobacteria bacterium]|nr:VCBS repeat-containing protein [Deltaproteobacteria bacterium]